MLSWYSVGILGCSTSVPGNVQLFRRCSRVFRCSAGVPCSIVPCSGVPGFIVCSSKYIVFLDSFLYSHLSTELELKSPLIIVYFDNIKNKGKSVK